MRPASIIFLVISVLIIAAGLGLCFYAQNKAENEGIQLFDTQTEESGDTIETVDFTDLDIGRISLNLSECDVYITRGESSYAELINFKAGRYVRSGTNQTFSVDDTYSLTSLAKRMFSLDKNSFEFKGIRQYLQYYSSTHDKIERKKKINIYINPEDEFKKIEISVGSGTVTLGELPLRSADYTVNVSSGDVIIENITRSSTVTVNVAKGNVIADIRNLPSIMIEIDSGDFNGQVQSPESQNYAMTAESGKINFLGNTIPSPHEENHPIASSTINVTVKEGNINITSLKSSSQKQVD